MKRLHSVIAALAGITAAIGIGTQLCSAENPIVQTIYTSDPAPMVYDDVCYVYTGHDADGSSYFTMPDWQCYSSTDMKNWTNHGTILADTDFSWSEHNSAWAAQCIERNGKFYMYVTLVPKATGGRAIGVAVADSPTGPFKDALGKPLAGPNWDYIDPTVFIDDDGQAYLYFGNPNPYYVKLNEDMISLSGQVNKVNLTTDGFGTRPGGDERHRTLYEEGPWFYKRGSLYYLMYAASGIPENICYSTSSSPTGPWKFEGVIMPSGGGSFTNHSGIVDYKGNSYFFYHTGQLPGGGGFTRSVAVEEFTYKPDGKIPVIPQTKSGPKQLEYLNPYAKTEAETMCWESGLETEKCSEGGIDVCSVENGDYIKLCGVDFQTGANKFTVSAASASGGGTLELRLGGVDGKLIGKCNITGTGGWQSWKTFSCDVSDASGTSDLYLKFTGGGGSLFNLDWWQFDGDSVSNGALEPDENGYLFCNSFEKNTEGWEGRGGASVAVSKDSFYDGEQSLLVNERTASWNGAMRSLKTSDFKPGETYSFSAITMQDVNESESFKLTLEYTDSSGEVQYAAIARASTTKGEWVQLSNSKFEIPAGAMKMKLFVETETEDEVTDFYVDKVIAAVSGTVIEGPVAVKVVKGDINSDGKINVVDVCIAKSGLVEEFSSNIEKLAADVNGDGKTNIEDILVLQNYVMGMIEEFPETEK